MTCVDFFLIVPFFVHIWSAQPKKWSQFIVGSFMVCPNIDWMVGTVYVQIWSSYRWSRVQCWQGTVSKHWLLFLIRYLSCSSHFPVFPTAPQSQLLYRTPERHYLINDFPVSLIYMCAVFIYHAKFPLFCPTKQVAFGNDQHVTHGFLSLSLLLRRSRIRGAREIC